jgi:hypothetical protein
MDFLLRRLARSPSNDDNIVDGDEQSTRISLRSRPLNIKHRLKKAGAEMCCGLNGRSLVCH